MISENSQNYPNFYASMENSNDFLKQIKLMKTGGIDHPFVWNARKTVLEGSDNGCINFLKSVVDDSKLCSLPDDSNEDYDQSLHNVTVASQISFEIAEYLFQTSDYTHCIAFIYRARGLYHLANLDPSNEFIEYDLHKLDILQKFCEKMLGQDSYIEIYLKKYILGSTSKNDLDDKELVEEMIEDLVDQKIPLFMKRLLLQEYKKCSHHVVPKLALIIAILGSINSLLYQNERGVIDNQENQYFHDQDIINQIRIDMLEIPTKDLSYVLDGSTRIIPESIMARWRKIWSTVVYCNLKSDEEIIEFQKTDFVSSLLKDYPFLIPSESAPAKVDRTPFRNSSPTALEAFYHEILLSTIYENEHIHIPSLKPLKAPSSYLHSLALKEYDSGRYISTLTLLDQMPIPDEELQQSAVISQFLTNKDQVLRQFLELNEVVPPFKVFGKVICELLGRGWVKESESWGSRMVEKMGDSVSLNWWSFVGYVCGFREGLVTLGVITGDSGAEEDLVVAKLDEMKDDLELICSTGRILAKLIVDDEIFMKLMCEFLKIYPVVAKFVVGCLSGFISKFLGEGAISIEALGVYGVFGIKVPADLALQWGIPNLASNVAAHLNFEFEEPIHFAPALNLLKEYCLSQVRIRKDYLLYADVLYALKDYNFALRYYMNHFLKETDYWRNFEMIPKLLERHLKKIVEVSILANRNLTAAVLLQFQKPAPYSQIFQLLKPCIEGLKGSIKKPFYDPPWQLDSSAIYAFVNMNVIEFVGSHLKHDNLALEFLEGRVRRSIYIPGVGGTLEELFRFKILVWYLRKLCSELMK